ncbi:hypothetical protein ABPG74_016218 [Tetrahymena malaccensis]
MQYNAQLEQIMVINNDNLIFTDPYTLKAISSFPYPNLQQISLIDQTNYIMLTNQYNTLLIYDYMQQKLIITMDNTKKLTTFPNNAQLVQYFSDFYTLSNGKTIILTSNDMGIITWSIDLINLTYQFNGYIQQCLTNFTKSDPISNLRYTLVKINDAYQPILWVGSLNNIYSIKLQENSDASQILFGEFENSTVTTQGRWYQIQESNAFYISSGDYVTKFDYQAKNFTNNLYFYGDLYCRKFIRQQQGQIDQFILLSANKIKLYDKGNFGQSSQNQKNDLSGNVRQNYGSFYKIKNILDNYFIKSGENGSNSKIFVLPMYPINDNGSILDITSLYGLNWQDINLNLDPFYLNNTYLVAFAFPKKPSTLNYLFMLLDCTSLQKSQYLLKSDKPDDSAKQTAFIVASLENQNNLELIGVDNLGTVYSWDLSKNNFPFKFSQDFSFCKNSLIGDIFHYNEIKRLIISCDDNKVYSLDYTTGNIQLLAQMSQQPYALKAFSKANIVAIGDFNSGVAYIFKFNIASKQFDLFLKLQSSKIQDSIIYIEMLNDNTIWVQYTFSNLFYSLNDCLQNSNLCTQCTQQYNFIASDQYDSQGVYGVGTQELPFTTSNNLLTAMIKIVVGVSNMFVDISVTPNQILNLNPRLMNFDFNSIISLNFNSIVTGSYAMLQYQNLLTFQNYNQVGFQDIIIYFGLDDETYDCGLQFSNIENNVLINNIQLFLYSPTSKPKSCQSIYSDSSTLNVLNYQISGEDFTNHQSVLQYFNVSSILFNNFTLTDCTLGDSFSILKQQSDLKVAVSNVTLSNNVCSPDTSSTGTQSTENISALFSAGYFNVQNMKVNNNTFCKKIIFSVVSSIDQANQVFSFQNIYIDNNLFQARTTFIFLNALYSMKAIPTHELDLSNIQFNNNTLIKSSKLDQVTASYFQTTKIAKINAQNIKLINHFDIQLGFFQFINNFDLINFNCVNDDTYLAKIPNQQTYGCLQLNEFTSANITQIQIINKKAQDTSLLLMENSQIESSNLSITKGVFENLLLFQNGVNTEAIPIQVQSSYKIEITLDTCLFQNITLKSIPYTLTYSTSALWIQNYVGNVLIKNSQFYSSYSNSQYGLIFIQANQLTLDTVQFNNATFSLNQPLPLFNSYGAMLNVKAQTLNILKSNFSQATAIKGAFIYMISFDQIFQVNISDSIFNEGYADQDGGAIYIDSSGQQLQFNCQNCQFSNIYTQSVSASTIGQEKYQIVNSSVLNKISFQGGFIKNVYGVTDNYFIDTSNTILQFNQIPTIISELFISNSLPQQLYLTKFKGLQQQATMANLFESSLQISGCTFSNIEIQSYSSISPLLISSTLSNITITDTKFEDSLFSGCAIYALQSDVQFERISFKNVSQALSSNRIIQQSTYSSPDPYGASLTIFQQSTVSIKSKSSFVDTSCNSNCNGGAIQLLQSTITLDDTQFQNIYSSFGGALYVQGMNSSNTISNSQFVNCKSLNDGGALYMKALQKDTFSLSITSSIFDNNSCKNRGGAIYIDSDIMNSPLQSVSIADSKIIHNLASIGGGIFQQNLSVNDQKNNVISSNKGSVFGNDNISYPSKLRVSNIDEFILLNNGKIDKNQITINNFRSGANLTNIQFLFLNDKNEVIYPITQDEYDTYKINVAFDPKTANLNQYSIDGNVQASFDPKIKTFRFENITLIGKPGSSASLQFSSKQIYGIDSKQAYFVQNYTFNIIVNFRLCGSGEQITQLAFVKEEEKHKKKMDPEIKQKYLILLKKFTNLDSEQKKKLVMEIYEQRLVKQYGHLFDDKREQNEEKQQNQDEENLQQVISETQFCGTLKLKTKEEDSNFKKQIDNQETLTNLVIQQKQDSDDNLIRFDTEQSVFSNYEKSKSKFSIEAISQSSKQDQKYIENNNQNINEINEQKVKQYGHLFDDKREENEEKQQNQDEENPQQVISETQFCGTLKLITQEEDSNCKKQIDYQETLTNLVIQQKLDSDGNLIRLDTEQSVFSNQEKSKSKFYIEAISQSSKEDQVNIQNNNQNISEINEQKAKYFGLCNNQETKAQQELYEGNPDQSKQKVKFEGTLKFLTQVEDQDQDAGSQCNNQEAFTNLAIHNIENSDNDLFKFDDQDSLQESDLESNVQNFQKEVDDEILKENQVNIEMINHDNSYQIVSIVENILEIATDKQINLSNILDLVEKQKHICAKCPLLQTYDKPLRDQNFVVKNYLRIPKTNVLVVNTFDSKQLDSSIVYYNDMSSSSGEVISVIKPDYVIFEMQYNTQTDQIVISNSNTLIFADPYSLNSLYSFSIPHLSSLQIIQNTNYIILTNTYNQLQLFDFVQQMVVLILDNTSQLTTTFQDNIPLYQYYSDIYQLKNGKTIIITTNDNGLIAWGIDFTQLNFQFYGYIQDSQVLNEGDGYRSFTKHPTEDIVFITGEMMQVLAVHIIDIENGQFQTLLNAKLYDGNYTDYLQNIQFVKQLYDGQYYPCLWVGATSDIYQVYIKIADDFSSISLDSYYYYDVPSYYRWYTIEENSAFFISSLYYITIFNYQTFEWTFNLYFYGDNYSKKFIRQQPGQTDRFILLRDNQILLYDRGNFGTYDTNTQKPPLSQKVYQSVGNFYQVKNTFDWYFMKSGDSSTKSLIFTFPIYPLNQTEQIIDITKSYNLKWSTINSNLDPFYLNGKIYVALSFPGKSKSYNYLFILINCQSTKEIYYLTSKQTNVTLIQTAFAVPSLEDPSNLELIGVDNLGTVYSWDLSKPNFPFKYSINFSACQNSTIGQVFQYQNVKKLIVACIDNNVYSFDLATGDQQVICKVSVRPQALRAFSNSSLIAIGDANSGIAYIFKFNSKTFDFFLQLQSTKVQDKLLYIELLNDQTIWVQYIYSNIFYALKDCLSDSTLCTKCTQQYYFNATNNYDSNGVYGMGTSDNPFTTSYNFLTAMIKAQYYKQIVYGVSDMSVEILINPGHMLKLNPNLMNFDFNSIISINFQSTQPGTYASLEYQDTLTLQNYNQVDFQDIIINFLLSQNTNNCGLILSNILQGIVLNNIQLLVEQKSSTSLSCQSIYVDSSHLLVKQYNIIQEDFTNHKSIITTFNSTSIELQNFSLQNSTLGDNFSILNQKSNIQANITNLTITGNICVEQSNQNDEAISVLFSAGLFNVKNVYMEANIMCKKSIFSTVSSLQQNQQVFSFSNISVINNQFQARTTYLFFDAFYSMRATPSHELDLNQVTFFNNQLIKHNNNDINSTSFFQTSKIANISITDSKINNHFDIEFGSFENVVTINVTGFQCQNDDTYLANIPTQQTIGCLQLNEVYQTILTQIQVIKKSSQDSTLISLQNNLLQQSLFSITKGIFSDLVLNQNGVNTVAIPLYVISNYEIDMVIDTCIFQNIFLNSNQFTLTYSTTALWVVNYVGSVIIKNSYFLNSYSNSHYGQIYVQANALIIDTVQFNNSTFSGSNPKQLFISQGGMINAKASNITIINSNFTEATASKGSFLYFVSFGQTFYLNFTNVLFSEGYALIDGGAMFIDTNGQFLQLNCNNCQFSNIYTILSQASTIGVQKYSKVKSAQQNQVTFYGGYIKNTFGVVDNYFLDVKNTNLQFLNISSIYSEVYSSTSSAYRYYLSQNTGQQQATLANLQNSVFAMQNCNISNIQITSPSSTFPLLINSQSSQIILKDSIIEKSNFATSIIYLVQSQIEISKVNFININQKISSNRLIQQDIYLEPSQPSNSLIIAQQSIININQNTNFSQINCNQNCNGGALLVNSGILNMDNIKFSQIQSTFGGALFIYGLNQTNQISNTQFLNCISQNDGGALFLYALKTDKFTLTIDNSIFSQNQCNSRGGAIYINSDALNSENQKVYLSNSKIIYNQANIGGGIFNQNLSIDTKQNNELSSNSANIYGRDEVSYASHMRISNIDSFLQINGGLYDKGQIIINNFRSGSNLSDIQFVFLNNKNEIIFPITSDDYQTYAVNVNFDPNTKNMQAYTIRSDTIVNYNKQLQSFKFSNITLVGTPGSSANIQFTSKQIYTLNEQTQTFVQNYTFSIIINFRLCGPGEQITQIGLVTECQICPIDYYTFEPSNCQECPEGATCSGGTNLVTKSGYWRKTNISTIVLSCSNLPDNCVGGDFGDFTCYEGHIGALCEECDILSQIIGGYLPKIQSTIQSIVVALSKKIGYFKKFVKEDKPKKQVKPEIKEKYKVLFNKILTLKPQEKKDFFLKIMEQQLVQSHGYFFQKDDEEQNILQMEQKSDRKNCLDDQYEKNQQKESKNQLQNKQKQSSIISSPPFIQDMDVNLRKTKEVRAIELIKLENQSTQQEEQQNILARNQFFDSNRILDNRFEKQLNNSNNNEAANKQQQSEIVNEELINIELNECSKSQKNDYQDQQNSC